MDITDGHFVPNLSFGPGTVSALAPIVHAAKGTVECHLMRPIRTATWLAPPAPGPTS